LMEAMSTWSCSVMVGDCLMNVDGMLWRVFV
jgi:hypothetical protein